MKTNEQIAMRVSWQTIIVNILLSAFKLFAGIFAHSAAMVSDAAESLSDIVSTIFVMIGVKMAGQKPDKEHPYGHERMECVSAIVLAVIVCATGIGIGYHGVMKIVSGYSTLAAPGFLALIAAAVTMAVKEGMYWYTRAAAIKISSDALLAEAWHHRSDALSSIGSFAGILGAILGVPVLDPAASVIISIFIVKAAIGIFLDAVGKMTDRSCDDSVVEELRRVILEQPEVLGIDSVNTRLFGSRFYVDVEIIVDGDVPLRSAHETAHRVHDAIESQFTKVKHCMVHVNPTRPEAVQEIP